MYIGTILVANKMTQMMPLMSPNAPLSIRYVPNLTRLTAALTILTVYYHFPELASPLSENSDAQDVPKTMPTQDTMTTASRERVGFINDESDTK
jgi:hypothetical protein